MKSKTKITLEWQTLTELCKRAFGGDVRIGKVQELEDGCYNAIYHIQLADSGEETVLKVSPPSGVKVLTYEQGLMKTEVETNKMIRENTSIPMPEILYCNFDRDIVDADFFFMRKLEGRSLYKIKSELTPEQLKSVKRQLGKYMAELHTIGSDFFGYFNDSDSPENKSWKATFLKMVKDILNDGRTVDIQLPTEPEDILELMESKSIVLNDVTDPKLTYFDLWEGNVFVVEKNGRYEIEGLIDCERALWSDSSNDFVSIALLSGGIANEPDFLEAYSEAAGDDVVFDDSLLCRLSMYKIYLYLIMVIETEYRSIDDSFLEQKVFATELLKQELEVLSHMTVAN
ncbi:MAG: aminoglycoside phosphotransferase family protein [Proteobacteria bacterium]|nr:aminoglycoside phosphotransferase family protein [Pseudomonadota bacterium]